MKKILDETIVKKVATLARINLTDEEIKKFTSQLSDVLDAFKTLDEIGTTDIKPAFHPQEIKNIWRDDSVKEYEWNPLKNTEHKEGKYFRGPKIV